MLEFEIINPISGNIPNEESNVLKSSAGWVKVVPNETITSESKFWMNYWYTYGISISG
jgi:hypothetical protein